MTGLYITTMAFGKHNFVPCATMSFMMYVNNVRIERLIASQIITQTQMQFANKTSYWFIAKFLNSIYRWNYRNGSSHWISNFQNISHELLIARIDVSRYFGYGSIILA